MTSGTKRQHLNSHNVSWFPAIFSVISVTFKIGYLNDKILHFLLS